MKAIMVMFDSLNRHMLPAYGCDWVHAPNFERLAARSVRFDNCYVGSMPCMPARRELHTGRHNFLHCPWGPLEPFDDSMPEILKQNGIATHLVSDHYHYWEDGGCNYHSRYSNWRASRGQEGDPWMGDLSDPDIPRPQSERGAGRQDWINRYHMPRLEDRPQSKTFAMGMEFLQANHSEDDWFLQIETFDPHEPYFSHPHYLKLYGLSSEDALHDWPAYKPLKESSEDPESMRRLNGALISMCDDHLGLVLDAMDRYDLWKDTLLIVNTDHGFLLGEHGWWSKCRMPFYNQIAHIPLFIWDPRSGNKAEARNSLVQTIDLAPTLLEYFGVERPPDMLGKPLQKTVADDKPVRESAIFGIHGGHVNCTDGRYVYMRGPASSENSPLYEYTLMPAEMRKRRSVDMLRNAVMRKPFSFSKGCPLMKIELSGEEDSDLRRSEYDTLLFDLKNDPHQEHAIHDVKVEERMIALMISLMRENDAPAEQYERLGLEPPEN